MARRGLHLGEGLGPGRLRGLLAAAAVAATAALPAAAAAPSAGAGRWHFVLPGEPPFEYSILFRRDATGDETRLLVLAGAERFDLLSRQDPSGRDTTETITLLATGESLTRRLVLPGAPLPADCPPLDAPDACVLLSGNGGRLALPLTAFAGERAEATRVRARSLVSDGMSRALRRLGAQLARTYELDRYGDDFLSLIWPGIAPRRASPPPPGRRAPGCDFDAGFGRPCTPEDRRREAARAGG
ncbi:hypothetical protein FBQ97_08280 [Acidobacteria bacterium ACD]|nr:MAG: hypothetical protein EDX89_15580 [Acidobacteriota bacterium]MDL1949792.1 hypothetical protein [Acidobacteria bacterium ACD]